MANPTTPYVSLDFGTAIPGAITFQVKTCKSRRHQYYGTNRCPACKKEYDRRYHKHRRRMAKARKVNQVHLAMYANTAPLDLALKRAQTILMKSAIV